MRRWLGGALLTLGLSIGGAATAQDGGTLHVGSKRFTESYICLLYTSDAADE